MDERITDRKTATAWQKRYDADAPRVGDIAPDFELQDTDGNETYKLSDFRDRRPVALVFGSFT